MIHTTLGTHTRQTNEMDREIEWQRTKETEENDDDDDDANDAAAAR